MCKATETLAQIYSQAIELDGENYIGLTLETTPITEHFEISDAGVVMDALLQYRNNHWEELKEILYDFGAGDRSENRMVGDINGGHVSLLISIIDCCNNNLAIISESIDVARFHHRMRHFKKEKSPVQ